MTTPKIVITSHFGEVYPSLDYTALTGGSMNWNSSPTTIYDGGTLPRGWDGSAFWIGVPKSDATLGIWKAGTADMLKPTVIGTLDSVTGSGIGGGATWITDLFDTPDTKGGFHDTNGQYNLTGNPCGLEWPADADERLRTLHFYTQTYNGGWHVEAELTDGSFASPAPLALPGGDFVPSHFSIAWIAGSVCQLKFRIVKRTAGGGSIQCPACYVEAPVRLRRQKAF